MTNEDDQTKEATSERGSAVLNDDIGGIKAIERIRLIVNMKLATRGTGQEQLPTNEQLAIVALANKFDAIEKSLNYHLVNGENRYA